MRSLRSPDSDPGPGSVGQRWERRAAAANSSGSRRGIDVLASSGGTETKEKTEGETKVQQAPPWNVVVHDDPVTLMTYVTRVLMRVFGYAEVKARRLMLEVHRTGRSVVWTGGREQAETYVQKLQGHHLLASLEPGEI